MEVAGPMTEVQQKYVRRLQASSDHLLGLVNDVLDLAKVEAGQLTVERSTASAGRAIEAAVALLLPQAEAKGVLLGERGASDSAVEYVGDEHRVRQIILNLLSNAVKFTAPGGRVEVEASISAAGPPGVEASETSSWVVIRVRDTGIGMAQADLEALFAPFHQVDGGHTRAHGGTGLGLAISRRLARLMGGELTVESVVGEGSVFSLWLPRGDLLIRPATRAEREPPS